MLGDIAGDLVHALVALEEVLEVDRTLEDLVQLRDVGDPLGFGDRPELPLHELRAREHLVRGDVVIERERRPVLDAFAYRVFVRVSTAVGGAEGLKRALAVDCLVHRRAREADEDSVGNGRHEIIAEVAAGRAVGLVDHHEDVRPLAEVGEHPLKLVDGRDDDAAVVVPEQLVERGDTIGMLNVLDAQRREVSQHLIFQLVAIDEDEDGGLVRFGRLEQQLGRLDHRERLPAALRVPNKAAPSFCSFLALDGPLCPHQQRRDLLLFFAILRDRYDVGQRPVTVQAGHKIAG